jgi:lactoylglutathione lyase
MNIAKPALDVGLYTNQLDPMLAFWAEQAQLPYSEMLPVGGGVRQHRHAIGQSVLKINHKRSPLPANPPTGLSRLDIPCEHVDERVELIDPDGNEVHLIPPDGTNLCLHLTVNDLVAQRAFYGRTLGLEECAPNLFAVGLSRIQLEAGKVATPAERDGKGYRYMTLQVYDVVGEHANILANGGTQGMAPVRLGEVAYISFVRDPEGNWIEISQRKSITGSLD